MMIVGMMMLGAATKRSHDDGRRRRRRRQGVTIRTGGEGWSAVSLLSLLAGAAAQDEDDGAVSVDDGEGESSTNSDIAKAVERWLPLFLGLVLALAVLGWCAVNVYRASKLQSAEEELAAAEAGKGGGKVPGSTSISAAPSRHSSMRQPSLRHPSYRLSGERGGTGDVSPEVDGAIEPKRSLRGSALSSGHQHGALTGAGGAVLLPALLFRGDELQGKKAPGEQGDVYQNPMQRRPRAREVSTPDTSEATQSSGSGRGRHPRTTTKPSSDRNRSSSSDDDEDSDEIVGFNMMELGQGQRGKVGPFASSSSSAAGAGQRGRRASGSSSGNSGRGKGGQASKGAPHKQQAQEGGGRRGSERFSSGSGRRGSDGRRSGMSSGGRAGGGNTDDSPDGVDRAHTQADFARSLPPAVLRSARPIPRNPSSNGVERGFVAH